MCVCVKLGFRVKGKRHTLTFQIPSDSSQSRMFLVYWTDYSGARGHGLQIRKLADVKQVRPMFWGLLV